MSMYFEIITPSEREKMPKYNTTVDDLINEYWKVTDEASYEKFAKTTVRQFIKERLPKAKDEGCDRLYQKATPMLSYGVEECMYYLEKLIEDIKLLF